MRLLYIIAMMRGVNNHIMHNGIETMHLESNEREKHKVAQENNELLEKL